MQATPDPPMIIRSLDAGGFIRVNEAFRQSVGYDAAELSARPLLDWIEPDDRPRVEYELADGSGVCTARHRTRDGSSVELELRLAGLESGEVVLGRSAAAANMADLEEDIGDSATVRGTLHTIAKIVEEQNPGYKCSILLVEDGRFVRGAGPSLPEEYNAAIDGFAIGPTVGSCGTAIYWNAPVIVTDIQADPLWVPFAELAKAAGVAACWSHPFTSRSGRVLGALALYSPEPRKPTPEQISRLRAAAGMTGLAVERGRAEEALRVQRQRERELEEQLRQAAKMEALGVLAGGVAHDFNNVLATILGNAEFGLRVLSSDHAVAGVLSDIVTASERAAGFCRQMLAYSGQGPVRKSRIDVKTLVPQVSSLVGAAVSKKTTLEYDLHDGDVFVEGDESQLLQVIMNLVTNAADALGNAEGTIRVASAVSHYDREALESLAPKAGLGPGSYVRITVSDTGCGMDAGTAERMFDPFFTTKVTGHGLGLAAVKGIVRDHGGTLAIQSTLGEGTSIAVVLPTTSKPATVAVASRETNPSPPKRKRILVADDEADLRSILSKQLQLEGFEVVEAADGEFALNAFREDPGAIDCVLLDLSMPRLSGDEVLRGLRELRDDVPIVLMSGYARENLWKRFADQEIAEFLQKPICAADLHAAIRTATGT